jgi:hypothetical protein
LGTTLTNKNSIREEIKSRLKLGNACYYLVQNLLSSSLVADIEGGTRLKVYEKRVLRKIFGPKRDEVTGKWRKLCNEDLSDIYSLPNSVRVVKSRRMRWAGHVAHMG